MSNPIFLGQDLTDVVFTSSVGDDASYPATNLNDYLTSPYWKSANNNSDQYLVIDMGSSGRSRNAIALSNHNLNGLLSYGDLYIDAADDAAFTVNSVNLIQGMLPTTDPFYQTFAACTKRYYRIYFHGTLTAVPYIGNVLIDAYVDPGYNYEFPYQALDKSYLTTEVTALDGTLRATQMFAGRKEFVLKFKLLNDAFRTNWQAFHALVRGKLRPFYFVDTDGTVYYVKLDSDKNPLDVIAYQQNNLEIKLKSQSVG